MVMSSFSLTKITPTIFNNKIKTAFKGDYEVSWTDSNPRNGMIERDEIKIDNSRLPDND